MLQLFKKIVAIRLPAHTSYRTQVLDYSVLSPFKNSFRNLLNKRDLFDKAEKPNDVYNLCEIINKSYVEAVTAQNIFKRFEAYGV